MLAIAVSLNIIKCSVSACVFFVRKTRAWAVVCVGRSWFGSIVIVFIFVDKWAVAGSLIQGHLVCYGYVCMYVCVRVCLQHQLLNIACPLGGCGHSRG